MEFVKTSHKKYFKSNLSCAKHPAVLRNLRALAQDILQPIRVFFDNPVIITSGYRCPDLNKAVKGSNNSQHLYGEAADFYVKNISKEKVFEWIVNSSNIVYGQAILEPSWIHITFPRMYKKLNQNFTAEVDSTGKMVYTKI